MAKTSVQRESTEKGDRPAVSWDEVEILIVGAGTMGASLTQAYAQSGFNVGVIDIGEPILKQAMDTIQAELENAARAGIFSTAQVEEIRGRILATTSYEEACSGKGLRLVIETATENIAVKKQIFRTLDRLCAPEVVFASNSSSLDVNILARETERPDKVVWMHYFYLPHKNRAGEYAGTDTASKESVALAARYMKLAGKVATPILSSRKGGAADVIFVALLLEAARMVDEGFDIPSIEAAGKEAYHMPVGFLGLMDATGIPLGIATMFSFSDDSDPDDPLYRRYRNFFTPAASYREKLEEYQKAEDKSRVKWISEEEASRKPEDPAFVEKLKERFLAVGFMTAAEVVDAGVIDLQEVDKLCQNAFLWREGPMAMMNRMGMTEALRMVRERKALAEKQGIHFPLPELLNRQARENAPWPLRASPILYSLEEGGRVARIMISHPRSANALDSRVFEEFRACFRRANADDGVKVILFDSAPIKTFIAGANVPGFLDRIKEEDWRGIREDTEMWQDVLFHEMTGGGKPKVAIVDGAAFGGGVEVALAFALDPDAVVIVTDRTSFTLPETRLGIYPGLRGTLVLPQAIHRATGDPEAAVAWSRYYILAGGTPTSSPRIIKHLGLADFLVRAKDRDRTAADVARAVVANDGKPLDKEHLQGLGVEELPDVLTFEEKEELRCMKELFLKPDLIPTLYAYGRGWAEVFFSGETKAYARRIARRVANNSPHAVWVADLLINRGFSGYLRGIPLDDLARWELENYLELTFQHPDAREGLSALVERRFPEFNRRYPFSR